MSALLEVLNSRGELALSTGKPAIVLDPWLSARVNADPSYVGSLRSGRIYRWRCTVSDPAMNDANLLIGFRTNSSAYAAVSHNPRAGRIEVWSNSSNLWSNGFELAVFRRSTAIIDKDPNLYSPPSDPDCEIMTSGTTLANTRTVFNSAWPNVLDVANFQTRDVLLGNNTRTRTQSFTGGPRTGGVDWIVANGPMSSWVRWSDELNLITYKEWYIRRYIGLLRISGTSDDSVSVTGTQRQYFRSSKGRAVGLFIVDWPDHRRDYPVDITHNPNFMVFRTFGTYK